MNALRTIVISSTLLSAATLAMVSTTPAAPKSWIAVAPSDEISAAHRRKVTVYPPAPRPYRGFADPSFGPDGRPYPVPENLRNQCYIDMGYGRFQACSNRS